MLSIGKSIQTERRSVVARGWEKLENEWGQLTLRMTTTTKKLDCGDGYVSVNTVKQIMYFRKEKWTFYELYLNKAVKN